MHFKKKLLRKHLMQILNFTKALKLLTVMLIIIIMIDISSDLLTLLGSKQKADTILRNKQKLNLTVFNNYKHKIPDDIIDIELAAVKLCLEYDTWEAIW